MSKRSRSEKSADVSDAKKKSSRSKRVYEPSKTKPQTNKTFDLGHTAPLILLGGAGIAATTPSPTPFNTGNTMSAGDVNTANPINQVCLNSGIPQYSTATAGVQARKDQNIRMSAIAFKGIVTRQSAVPSASITTMVHLIYLREVSSGMRTAGMPDASYFFTHTLNKNCNHFCQTNLQNVHNFKILKSWRFHTGPETGPDDISEPFEAYVKLKGLETSWLRDGNTGLFTEMNKGALILVVGSLIDQGDANQPYYAPATTNQYPIVSFTSRLYFSD